MRYLQSSSDALHKVKPVEFKSCSFSCFCPSRWIFIDEENSNSNTSCGSGSANMVYISSFPSSSFAAPATVRRKWDYFQAISFDGRLICEYLLCKQIAEGNVDAATVKYGVTDRSFAKIILRHRLQSNEKENKDTVILHPASGGRGLYLASAFVWQQTPRSLDRSHGARGSGIGNRILYPLFYRKSHHRDRWDDDVCCSMLGVRCSYRYRTYSYILYVYVFITQNWWTKDIFWLITRARRIWYIKLPTQAWVSHSHSHCPLAQSLFANNTRNSSSEIIKI